MYNGIFLSLKKKGNSEIWYNMEKAEGYYAKWNTPGTKRQVLCDSTYMK